MPLREEIPKEFFKASDARSAVHSVICIVGLTASGVIAYHLGTLIAYVVAFLLVGIFGEALFILQHDTMHASFFSSRRLSDMAGITISAILGTRLYDGRAIHMRHHVKLGAPDQDPNLYWYDAAKNPPGWAVIVFMMKQLFGGKLWPFAERTIAVLLRATSSEVRPKPNSTSYQDSVAGDQKKAKVDVLLLIAMQTVILLSISLLSAPWIYFVFFFLPIVTVTSFLEAVRVFSEHVHYADGDMPLATKQRLFLVKSNWLERMLLAPYGFHFHHLHHIYPAVPVFRLKALHEWMTIHVDSYKDSYVTRSGYFAVLFRYAQSRPLE